MTEQLPPYVELRPITPEELDHLASEIAARLRKEVEDTSDILAVLTKTAWLTDLLLETQRAKNDNAQGASE